MPPRKVDHRYTKCCKCDGGTYIRPDRIPVWFKDLDNFKRHTGKYVCHDCYRGIDRKKIEDKKNEFENRRCCICRSDETYIKLTGGPLWRKYKGDDWRNYKAGSNTGKWDGKSYLCDNCYGRIISNFPDSRNSLRKKIANSRNRQIDPDSTQGKGHITEQIATKTLGLENYNLETDNFCAEFDAYDPIKYHRIDIKGPSLIHGVWTVAGIGENFDNLIILCMSNDYSHVIKVYIIPKEFIGDKTSIKIYEGILNMLYDKFMVDEKPYDETFHNMDASDFPLLRGYKKKK